MTTVLKIVSIILLIMIISSPALAEGAAEAHGQHGFDWIGFLGKLFNSIVLFGGLIYFLRKPMIEVLSKKSIDIKADILQREELVLTTSNKLAEIIKRLDKIEDEVTAIKHTATEQGKSEQSRIAELGDKEAQRILELTDSEIAIRVENSVRNLKAKIADLTIDHFKQQIEQQLDHHAHEKIIAKNIHISGDIIERE